MQLLRQDYGTVLAIAIQDESTQIIIYEHNSFFNHSATNSDPIWLNEQCAYFWTKPANLRHAIIERCLFRLINVDFSRSKGLKRGLLPQALKLAEIELNSIKPELFLDREHQNPELAYRLGYIDYNIPDLTSLSGERYRYL